MFEPPIIRIDWDWPFISKMSQSIEDVLICFDVNFTMELSAEKKTTTAWEKWLILSKEKEKRKRNLQRFADVRGSVSYKTWSTVGHVLFFCFHSGNSLHKRVKTRKTNVSELLRAYHCILKAGELRFPVCTAEKLS